jgi:hypothetical protein
LSIITQSGIASLSNQLDLSAGQGFSGKFPVSGLAGISASFSGSHFSGESSSAVLSIIAQSGIASLSNQLDLSAAKVFSAKLLISCPAEASALLSESDISGVSSCAVFSMIVPSETALLSNQPVSSISHGLSVKFSVSRLAGVSRSFSQSDVSDASSPAVLSIISPTGMALLSKQFDSSVSERFSTEFSLSDLAGSSASFSESAISGGSSCAVFSMVGPSGTALLSNQHDSSVSRSLSVKFSHSHQDGTFVSFLDSGIARGSFLPRSELASSATLLAPLVRPTRSADFGSSGVADSPSLFDSGTVDASLFNLSSILARTRTPAFSSQLDASFGRIVSGDFSNTHVVGESASFSWSGIARQSSFDVSSILASSRIAGLSNRFGRSLDSLSVRLGPSVEDVLNEVRPSVVQTTSGELSISGPTGTSAWFSDSSVAHGSSFASSSVIARSIIASLSIQPDLSVVRSISAELSISGPTGTSAWFSDSGIPHGSSFGVSSAWARTAAPDDSSAIGLPLSLVGSGRIGATSIPGPEVQARNSRSLLPAGDVGEAQGEAKSSAGKIAGAVVGSVAAGLGIAGGVVVFRMLRRKSDPPESSYHEATVEEVDTDPSDEFSQTLAQGCGSFDEFTDEAFFVSGGAPLWREDGGQ